MKQVILADIHSNIEALTSVLLAAEKEGEIAFCLGDVVGYGPNPVECLDAMRHYGRLTVMGNHDFAVLHPGITAIFNPEARTVAIRRVEYDFRATQRKIIDAGLPAFLAGRLSAGI